METAVHFLGHVINNISTPSPHVHDGINGSHLPMHDDGHAEDHEGNLGDWHHLKIYVVVPLFLLIAAGVKILYHLSHWLHTHVPESCVLIILGTAIGMIFYFLDLQQSEYRPDFTPALFFHLLLPPIILESAYSLHDKYFFNNIATILVYAIIGTCINLILIGFTLYGLSTINFFNGFKVSLVEMLIFSTLISAVDPVAVLAIFQEVNVNKSLYFLVFGESLLNDAVVIVMYNMLIDFTTLDEITAGRVIIGLLNFLKVAIGGFLVGVFLGIFTALLTRFTKEVRVVEPLIVVVCAYLSYMVAEAFHFSGIIGLIGCGLVQEEYAKHNISKKSYTTIKYLTKTLSSISDVIIFLFLGMVLWGDRGKWNTSFILTTTFLCVLYRFFSVFSLTLFANKYLQRVRRINLQEQVLMAYGGLRGAIAFSLSIMLKINGSDTFVTTTLFVTLFTVFVLGSTTKPVVKYLEVKTQQKEDSPKLFIEINKKFIETLMAGIESVSDLRSINFWSKKIARFNKIYLKRIFIRGEAVPSSKIHSAFHDIYQGQDVIKHGQENVNKGYDGDSEKMAIDEEKDVERGTSVKSRFRRIASKKRTDEPSDSDINQQLSDAFSKSAYYQHAGGFQTIEDRERKMNREIEKRGNWSSTMSKLKTMKLVESSQAEDGKNPAKLMSVLAALKKKSGENKNETNEMESNGSNADTKL